MYGKAPDCRAGAVPIAIKNKNPPPKGRRKQTLNGAYLPEQGRKSGVQAPYSLLTNRSNAPSERTTLSVSVQ